MDEFLNGANNTANEDNQIESDFSAEIKAAGEPEIKLNERIDSTVQNNTQPQYNNFGYQNQAGQFANNYTNQNNATPFVAAYNPVNYSPINPIEDYKPMSKGLKVFALIMAAIILLTGSCFVGYYLGKNNVSINKSNSKVSVNLAATPDNGDEMTAAEVYAKVNKSIVGIRIYSNKSEGGQASGIILSEDGYIVTNDHIYSEVPNAKFRIYTHDGKEYDAKYVAGDQISDLAVLKIDKSGEFTPAQFGDSEKLFYGQNVVAIGRPNDSTDPSSITRGVISALNRRVQTTSSYSARLIQTDSAINPGSSGGALVNMYGQVVGVTSSKLASVEYDAVGYAIPTTVMKRIVDELIEKGRVESRAKLGVSYIAIDSVTKEMGGYATTGLLLKEVAEDSDLHGKVAADDYITHINGTAVTSDDIVLDIIEQSKAGDTITVTVLTKKGETKEVTAVLKANISESSYTTVDKTDGKENGTGGGTFDFPFGE